MLFSKRTPEAGNETNIRWYHKLRAKYRLIILNEDSFEEKVSFRMSRLNVFVVTGALAIILIFLTIYLIAFTPLREYIPGYSDTGLQRDLYELQLRADSIETALMQKDLFIINMRRLISGEIADSVFTPLPASDSATRANYALISLSKSREDSILRAEYEKENLYNIRSNGDGGGGRKASLSTISFFTPVKGFITNRFDASKNHYGIDIVSGQNEAVKAAYDGVVFFSEWTSETGNVIAIQHSGNIVTVYKHNAVLLRKQGAFVRAGESIAIVGDSGSLTTGPHLHFELWINSAPVDPELYMTF
ncbi:MAG: peptidase M23 [Bacteroidetes bacterium HGW-Bacteroidetes-11]|jgi:murein DD-endopeptidase MepM/ murein hydrolase activator NlpD|nr:MAG: peptidase M23 [Bacteroidetes bacterium HGW-Bacteroidetes-11]